MQNNQPVIANDRRKYYKVYRNGIPVSHQEYSYKEDAFQEAEYWKNIITRFPDGSKITIK